LGRDVAERGGPDLSWQTIVGALTAVALLGAAQWTIFQTQFSNVEKTAAADRAQVETLKAGLSNYLTLREHGEYRDAVSGRIDDLRRRVITLEAAKDSILSKLAHDPIESGTFQAVAKATDDRVTLLQNQITDINRQIAAALIIIDNNAGIARKTPPTLPP
jgi:hypothetical protein